MITDIVDLELLKRANYCKNYIIPDFIGRSVCFDIGSNVGGFPYYYRNRFDFFVCVEASYENYIKLINNMLKYKINMSVHNLAAYFDVGSAIKIYDHIHGDNGSRSVAVNRTSLKNWRDEWIENSFQYAITIDLPCLMTLTKQTHIDFMKVDIEGAESDFLLDQDLSFVDCIAIEMHYDRFEKSCKELDKYLKKYFNLYSDKHEFTYVNKSLKLLMAN